MQHKTTRIMAALGLCFFAFGANAGDCALVPSNVATIEESRRADLFQEMKFEELDKQLAQLHKKNMGSEGGDLLTLRVMSALPPHPGGSDALVRMWVDQRPESFFAQLRAGMYYGDQAFSARGSNASSSVNKNQWQKAKQLRDKAVPFLNKAMKLDPRSALPQAILLSLSGIDGEVDGRNTVQWLQAADQADPKNMAARINATRYLSPRWGGSFEQLDQMAATAGKSLSASSTQYLQYNVVIEKASHFEVIAKDKAKAQALYKQAKSMCDNSESARAGIVRTY